jgi:hypothetical protein
MTLLNYREALENLERDMERLTQAEAETSAIPTEAANAEDSFKRELLDIAPHWSEEDLAAADLSLAAERKARALGSAIEDVNKRIEKLMGDKSEEESKFAAMQAETAAKPNGAEKLTPDDYRAKRELLLDVRREMLHCDALRWEIRGEKACAELVEREMKSEGSPPARAGSYMPKILLA